MHTDTVCSTSSPDADLSLAARDACDIADLILRAGEVTLVNGAETYRVEETMERMGLACGARAVDGFVTPTGIFLSVTDASGATTARIRRVRAIGTDLSRVSAVNDLSRRLSAGDITPQDADAIIRATDVSTLPYSEAVRAISAGFGSACFSALFGGGLPEMLPAFAGGLLVHYVVGGMARASWSRFIAVLVGGLSAAFVGTAATWLFPVVRTAPVVIGNVMILVPGVAMTNAIRDVMSGELVAGGSRFLEALVTAVTIAIGVALWLSAWKVVTA